MSFDSQMLIVAVLVAGVLIGWRRSQGNPAKGQRGRLHLLGWLLALAAIVVSLLAAATPSAEQYGIRRVVLVLAIGAAVLFALWPGAARRLVPPALILIGLGGFVLVRDFPMGTAFVRSAAPALARPRSPIVVPPPAGGPHLGAYGLVPVSSGGTDQLVLLQAYLFVLLGGWLTWHSADPALIRLRGLLGRVTSLPARAQVRALLVIPVALAAAELFLPGAWTSVAAACVLALWLGAAVAVLRRWPEVAARIAAAGLLFLGVVGVVLAASFQAGFEPSAYALTILSGVGLKPLVVAEAVGLLVAGAWLVPQSFPAARRILGLAPDAQLTLQVQRLTESRAVAVDTAETDLRRLERDLHDGAQARLVAVGMSLRAAERLIPVNPAAAVALVAEARDASARALTELRDLVRGVLPPVLADRGLADAIRALALDCPLRVQTEIDLAGRVAAPVETACYFAVAELLTNAAKHSGAREARVTVNHDGRVLRIEVTDFGLGGADPAAGSGLAGVERRLATFDGIVAVSSPAGGPTIVVLEVPCALSSLKTSSC